MIAAAGRPAKAAGFDPAAALGIARSLLVYYAQPWRILPLRRFYRALLAPGDLAFDIGAHVGNRTRAMRAAGARIVAVEPQPALARLLRATLPADGVTLIEAALGSAEGSTELRISRRHPTVSTASAAFVRAVRGSPGFEAVEWDRTIRVPMTTLDRLIAQFGVPRFVKIDVEGMEPEILAGLGRPLALVSFEFVPAALPLAFASIDRLVALAGDYRFNAAIGEQARFVSDRWVDAAEARELVARLAASGQSGDLYACRADEPPARESGACP